MEGRIIKALSGYYYVDTGAELVTCRARGKFRLDGTSPLVGDRVRLDVSSDGTGSVREILPRRNYFIRPAVANIDLMVMLAAAVNPVTDPFLIDRVIPATFFSVSIRPISIPATSFSPFTPPQASPCCGRAPSPARGSRSFPSGLPEESVHLRATPASENPAF